VELLQHLSDKQGSNCVPGFAGSLSYANGEETAAMGLLVEHVANQGDGWSYATDAVDRFFDSVVASGEKPAAMVGSVFSGGLGEITDQLLSLADGLFFQMIDTLGERTGQLHLALADPEAGPAFAPEPFSRLYQRAAYQNLRSQIKRTIAVAKRAAKRLDDDGRALVDEFVSSETRMLDFVSGITAHKINAAKIRIHGDFHLGQVLYTGGDFVIIDLEGEPLRTLSERRLKYSAFRDLAGMIRSFHYAVSSRFAERALIRPEDREQIEPWIEPWYAAAASTFLSGYFRTVGDASFIPDDPQDAQLLLNAFVLEKAVYEIAYEVNNRPDWIMIPLRGVNQVLSSIEDSNE
jgi:maltose alpha-D-glucosyltransferase/alpha-amylase